MSQTNSTTPLVFNIAEFCAAHRISRAGFYVLRARGEAPRVFKAGKRVLIDAEAARLWREQQTEVVR